MQIDAVIIAAAYVFVITVIIFIVTAPVGQATF